MCYDAPVEIARVRARNTAPDSENRMHDDVVAAAYGFRRGLVPGITVYGYMADPLGRDFLKSGGMKLRLLKPFYDGDEVIVERNGSTIEAKDIQGQAGATGTLATHPPPDLSEYPEAPLPEIRPPADENSLAPGRVLGTIYHSPLTTAADQLLELSNRVIMRNVQLRPWLHASSELQHFALARPRETLSVRARVKERFDRGSHKFAVVGVVVLGDDGRLIQHVSHTAIYEPAQKR